MTTIRGTEEQGATFVELFFDLVFVFAVTQVTATLAHDLTAAGLLRALIVFWLVWWAWTQYTWSLNEADTEHVSIRLITLVATALAFLMAVTVPLITSPFGWLFPISYLVLRMVGISLQWRLAAGDSVWARSVRTWTVLSSLGLLAVIAAVFLPADLRFVALGVAALLDVLAAVRAGRGEWRLFPGHFSERHGLFVIIVLGESLIAAGVTVTDQSLSVRLLLVAVTAVAGTCALWWTYFGWAKDALEERMRSQSPQSLGRFARDVYSFGHFPLIFGVIGFAIAIEEAIAHPKEPLPLPGALALCVGVGLIVGSTALAVKLAGVHVPIVRWWVIVVLLALIPVLGAVSAWVALGLVSLLVAGLALAEEASRR
ncbi:MAG TPA: low temperature requirement protein A [Acidimicrobiia bacterium]|nr:low temperature requirement protein A [Acidimicrobiia bacterium]